jgi:hypothetical protein
MECCALKHVQTISLRTSSPSGEGMGHLLREGPLNRARGEGDALLGVTIVVGAARKHPGVGLPHVPHAVLQTHARHNNRGNAV